MKTAMKAQDSLRLSVLRFLLAEIKKREIDNRTATERNSLNDVEIQKVISSLIKQRNDSIDAFKKGGRQDLVDKEMKELEILKSYLPEQLGAEELEAIIRLAIDESGAKTMADIGKVMKLALAKTAGKAGGKAINDCVRTLLAPK